MEITFDSCLNELKAIEEKLDEFYSKNSNLLDRELGIYKIFKNLISNLEFLDGLKDDCAMQPFATLSRMIIDNYSVFYLIAAHSTDKEKDLRYYLYLIDSLNSRANSITTFSNTIKENKLVKSFDDSNDIVEHDKRIIESLLNRIKSEDLNSLTTKKSIQIRNWKFTPINNKKERFSWEELYNIARVPKRFSKIIQNHFSTFTHGLGMTILYEPKNSAIIESTFLLLATLQLNIAKIIIDEFEKKVDFNLNKDFKFLMEFHWNNYEKWNH